MTKIAKNSDVMNRKNTVAKEESDFFVSIIIPIHNAEGFIDDTIQSVLGQTYKEWELVLVDDASTDRTLEIIKRFSSDKIRIVSLKKNVGAARARNRGVMQAKGRYICFLDADDLWQPDKLERQVAFMRKTKAIFSYTGYVFAGANGEPNGKVVRVPKKISYKQALKNTTIWTSTVMFDMRKLKKSDIKMPNIESEDTATWWKVLKKVHEAYGLNEVTAIYRRSSGTLSSNKITAIKRIWNLYRKYEKLNFIQSASYFVCYAFNAVRRRV